MQRASNGCAATYIALTGYGQEKDVQKAHEAGFDAHLIKPVEPETMIRLLVNLAVAPGQ